MDDLGIYHYRHPRYLAHRLDLSGAGRWHPQCHLCDGRAVFLGCLHQLRANRSAGQRRSGVPEGQVRPALGLLQQRQPHALGQEQALGDARPRVAATMGMAALGLHLDRPPYPLPPARQILPDLARNERWRVARLRVPQQRMGRKRGGCCQDFDDGRHRHLHLPRPRDGAVYQTQVFRGKGLRYNRHLPRLPR